MYLSEFAVRDRGILLSCFSSIAKLAALGNSVILSLQTLAKTALSVSSASRAIGQIEHLSSTTPERIVRNPLKPDTKLKRVKRLNLCDTTPSRKRKSRSVASTMKQPRVDLVLKSLLGVLCLRNRMQGLVLKLLV